MKENILYKYGYLWVTLVLFLGSFIGHWVFGWFAFVNEQEEHGQPVVAKEYVIEMSRDSLENWQSEFLQLMWQIAGLAFLLYVGSPQSKEGDERKEAKLDWIMQRIDKKEGDAEIKKLEKKYPKA